MCEFNAVYIVGLYNNKSNIYGPTVNQETHTVPSVPPFSLTLSPVTLSPHTILNTPWFI